MNKDTSHGNKGSCINCGKERPMLEFIRETYDLEMEAGICYECADQVVLPGPRNQQLIMQQGTPDQKEKLQEKIRIYNLQNPKEEIQEPITTPEPTTQEPINRDPAADQFPEASRYFDNRANIHKKPKHITYKEARVVFWKYYSRIVFNETGSDPTALQDQELKAMANFVKWMIGDPEGDYDIRKSIYLFGPLGVGKSTIALAGYYTMGYLKNKYRWANRYYKFASLDELILENISNENLKEIGKLSKGTWCLDELRENYIHHKHYGTEIIPLILSARHNLWKRNGTNTIITSNVTTDALKEILNDDRLFDRIRQQYTPIELTGINKRHLK